MNQTRYIQKILSKLKMSDCKRKPTPCILGFKTTTNDDSKELTDPKLYRATVESLIYLMTGTKPDLCYVVTELSQKNIKTNTSRFSATIGYIYRSTESAITHIQRE